MNNHNFKLADYSFSIFYQSNNQSSKDCLLFLSSEVEYHKHYQGLTKYIGSAKAYFLDLPGFGKSSGDRGHIESWRILTDIVGYFLDHVMTEERVTIFGKGFSSLIAIAMSCLNLQSDKIKQIYALDPAFGYHFVQDKLTQALISFSSKRLPLAKIGIKALPQGDTLSPNSFSFKFLNEINSLTESLMKESYFLGHSCRIILPTEGSLSNKKQIELFKIGAPADLCQVLEVSPKDCRYEEVLTNAKKYEFLI